MHAARMLTTATDAAKPGHFDVTRNRALPLTKALTLGYDSGTYGKGRLTSASDAKKKTYSLSLDVRTASR